MSFEETPHDCERFTSVEEAYYAAGDLALVEPIVVVRRLGGAYYLHTDADLVRFRLEAVPYRFAGLVSKVLSRKSAEASARRRAAENDRVGAVVRVPGGYRSFAHFDFDRLPVALIEGIFPRSRCSFCMTAPASAEAPGFIARRFSACATCGESIRSDEGLPRYLAESAEEWHPGALRRALYPAPAAATFAASAYSVLTGSTAWVYPFQEGYCISTEEELQASVVAVLGTAVVEEFFAPFTKTVLRRAKKAAIACGHSLALVAAGPLVAAVDMSAAHVPEPFRIRSVATHVRCEFCRVGGFDPDKGEVAWVWRRPYCNECVECLAESDEDFAVALDMEA